MVYTTSSLFLKSLAAAGITHAFVNWGSDHPALLEDLQRQRVESEYGGETTPRIVICPNEMVALSAAQGYAQVTGRVAAVIIHVDVGTQALAGAIHNVNRCRAPVLIYAGASPFSSSKDLKGGRNEWIMWMQDIPDQSAIVRQYMRHTAQINSGRNVTQVVNRAVQIALSEPKGPVYLWARREVMEEVVPDILYTSLHTHSTKPKLPTLVSPSGLSPTDVMTLTNALLTSERPLIVTSHLGRNQDAVAALITLSTLLALPIYCSCPSLINTPFSHPYFVGITYLVPGSPMTDKYKSDLETADVIFVIDSDIPWMPLKFAPNPEARIFITDGGDPLKTTVEMGMWEFSLHPGVELVSRSDAEVVLTQVVEGVQSRLSSSEMDGKVREEIMENVKRRAGRVGLEHEQWIEGLERIEEMGKGGSGSGEGEGMQQGQINISISQTIHALREVLSEYVPTPSLVSNGSKGLKPLILNEGISNYPFVWEHLRPEIPGTFFTSGGSSLGWSLGAAVGAILGCRKEEVSSHVNGHGDGVEHDLVVNIVGDGSFLFCVPTSAYWMARRYETPFLTIVLNNAGWRSPKLSMLGVHPTGHGSKASSGEQLSVGFRFDPATETEGSLLESPDYSQVAVAATGGWAWGKRVGVYKDLSLHDAFGQFKSTLEEAVKVVLEEKRCAVIDVVLEAL
ncbi:thiamine diphosphate-binding protein [Dendrothele bispora CBS 962.96]|uniref:Thiamine diphosphate-binding protein n=1 Tax=Dendrothele bispora (strain CBS 962.96) TaxID=1314807 RepID=A0A4S8M929_DENBC|nr:thiamine diphosphate-binding protein [Dendrothele bispora CBS 962.96]